jgi:hypothetical protein
MSEGSTDNSNKDSYAIIFRGDIVMGYNLLDVKANLKKVFKSDDARIDSLFTGKAVPLKRSLTQQEAEHYKEVLAQAGAVVSIEASDVTRQLAKQQVVRKEAARKESSKKQTLSHSKPTKLADNVPEKETQKVGGVDWQLAPVGANLSDSKTKQVKTADVHIEHLAVLPQKGNLISDDERLPEAESVINVDELDWELTPYGESLLKEAERKKIIPVDIHISELSIAEAGSNLLKPEDKKVIPPLDINTDHIQLSSD